MIFQKLINDVTCIQFFQEYAVRTLKHFLQKVEQGKDASKLCDLDAVTIDEAKMTEWCKAAVDEIKVLAEAEMEEEIEKNAAQRRGVEEETSVCEVVKKLDWCKKNVEDKKTEKRVFVSSFLAGVAIYSAVNNAMSLG